MFFHQLDQVAQRGCGTFILENTESLTGQVPAQQGLVGPAFCRCLGWIISRLCFQFQLFCDSGASFQPLFRKRKMQCLPAKCCFFNTLMILCIEGSSIVLWCFIHACLCQIHACLCWVLSLDSSHIYCDLRSPHYVILENDSQSHYDTLTGLVPVFCQSCPNQRLVLPWTEDVAALGRSVDYGLAFVVTTKLMDQSCNISCLYQTTCLHPAFISIMWILWGWRSGR